jgi:hypothetical protein
METNKYTTLSIPFKSKDQFNQYNADWNIKNPNNRKTKEEFFEMIINRSKALNISEREIAKLKTDIQTLEAQLK